MGIFLFERSPRVLEDGASGLDVRTERHMLGSFEFAKDAAYWCDILPSVISAALFYLLQASDDSNGVGMSE